VVSLDTVSGLPGKPLTDPVAALGQALFWDPVLSGNKDVACATCHHPTHAYTDGLDLSLGTNATGYSQNRFVKRPNDVPLSKRNAPTLFCVAFNGMTIAGQYV
jgi:cytochrome c peroxidase